MELLRANFVNTTTQITVNDNTATAGYIFISDIRFQYSSVNFGNDLTTVSMTISFAETTTVDRIALVGHNLKSFTAFYNGATASTFALTSGDTTVSDYSTNSATSHFFRCTPVDCTSVTFNFKSTITPNQNKYLGYLVISEMLTDFDGRVPSAANYTPEITTRSIVHRLSDGGTRVQTLEDKWSAELGFDFVTTSVRDSLRTIFDEHEDLVFCPFGTTTAWDTVIFPCVWVGNFDFYRFSDNAADSGFSGSIRLSETPQ